MDKAGKLMDRLKTHGSGILSGLSNMVCERNPATVFGAVKRKTLIVGDFPGAAIYIRSKEIDEAGGDFDGDLLFVFNPDDPDGEIMYQHCMTVKPNMVKKRECFDMVTNIARKKEFRREVTLGSSLWLPEKEITILQEFKEKNIIGRMWYCLMHFMYLCAHFIPQDHERNHVLNYRLHLILQRARDEPDSDIAEELPRFLSAVHRVTEVNNRLEKEYKYKDITGDTLWVDFDNLTDDQWFLWHHMAYVAIAHACFPIYEIIFDLRKGEGRPPFNPNDVISALMGYMGTVDWSGMVQGGVWTDLLKSVWEDLPVAEDGGVDMLGAIVQFPVFYHLVNKRRLLTTGNRFQSTKNLTKYMGCEDFAAFMMDQLMLGR